MKTRSTLLQAHENTINAQTMTTSKRNATWIWSAVAVASMAILLHVTTDWHSSIKNDRPAGRILEEAIKNAPDANIDDDITRDETCRRYLMNFLNGTTDANDECQGMNNAWQAADCTDNDHLGRRHHAKNGVS